MIEALGIIETLGFTAAIQAADAAVKAANITLGDWVKVGGGKVNIIVRGDVAAVKAAVEAGVQAASKIGTVEAEVVISRPSDKLMLKFPLEAVKKATPKKSTK
jgi:microcompartment protein CcmL/EutN